MDITGVDFITVPTRDFDRASAFYADVLGLECSARWGQMPAARVRDRHADDRGHAVRRVRDRVPAHPHPIALHVDDVAAARAELEARA